MSADGTGPIAEAPAAPAAVWLWDPRRRRVLWANGAARALCGDGAEPLSQLLSAAGPAPARAVLGGVAGALAATRAALPDGRIGLRAVFEPEPETPDDGEFLRAAAFEAAAAPMAVAGPDGAVRLRNAAFRARFGGRPARLAPAAMAAGVVDGPDGARLTARPLEGGAAGWLLAPEAAPVETTAPRQPTAAAGAVSLDALARIAHEFRSPLTAVLGFAEFLRSAAEDAPPERLRGYLDDLSAAAQRMRGLADDLVALGAAAARGPVAEAALDALMERALRMAAPAAAARGVTLGPPPRSGLVALADAGALERAVSNLIDNAVRHGRAGGTVTVAARALGRGAGAVIEVSDDGPGMDGADVAAALAPYGRPGEGRGAERPGGLGLAIARETAEAHGGALEIDTAPGQGLTARIMLPTGRVVRLAP